MNNWFTYSCFHLYTSKELLEAHRVGPMNPTEEIRTPTWLITIKRLLTEMRNSLTTNGRRDFDNEIKKGDPIQFANIMSLTLQMNAEERSTFERLGQAIVKKEMVEFLPANEEDALVSGAQCEEALPNIPL